MSLQKLTVPKTRTQGAIARIIELYLERFWRLLSLVFLSITRLKQTAIVETSKASARVIWWPTRKLRRARWESIGASVCLSSFRLIEKVFWSLAVLPET